MELCNPSVVRELLEKYGLAPKKAFGQNFLINASVPERIAECSIEYADKSRPCGVLEIGPGVGSLTSELAERYDKVIAVEIDRGLIPLLGESLADYDNVTVIEADFMKLDLGTFIDEQFADIISAGGTVGVCANLPYYITSPVIMKILEEYPLTGRIPLHSIVVMIQKEVAARFAAEPGTEDYGSVTASIALRANVEKLLDVSPGCFLPAPKVSSAVIGIVPHGGIREVYPESPSDDRECLEFAKKVSSLIELAFLQRRKTLVNALSSVYPKDTTIKALEAAGLRPDIRGEKLSPSDFCRLAGLV